MAIERRHFLRYSIGALLAAPFLWVAERALPVRYTEALRARFYPGPIKPANAAKHAQPGKWAG